MISVEFKYNVGDVVWLMAGSGVLAKPSKAKIGKVQYSKYEPNKRGEISYQYHLPKPGFSDIFETVKYDTCLEKWLFPTKEELLASL